MVKKLTAYVAAVMACAVLTLQSAAQTLLPPNQPEQDACNALVLCGSKFTTPYSYQGVGHVVDLNQTPCGSGEGNSVWLKLQVSASGTIVFTINPVDSLDDYDFAVINLAGTTCGSLSPANVVRCNFNNNLPGSNYGGIVGLNMTSTLPTVANGASGNPFCQYISAVAGETYLVMINNFGHDDFSGPSKGFSIDFTGSTATFNQPPPPAFASINSLCGNPNSLTVQLTNQALCNSIAADGSDFSVSPATAISSASGVNCSGQAGYTNTVTITFTNPPAPGMYTLNAKQGTDGNTLLGLCGSQLVAPGGITFTVPLPVTTTDSQHICYSQLPYTWNGISVTKGGSNAATFVGKTTGGCDSTVVLNLTVSAPPVTNNTTKTICSGQAYKLPWNDSSVTTAGVYSHTYTTVLGCDSLTANITVNVDNPSKNAQVLVCSDSSKVLSIGPGFTNYQWGDGETTPTITVNRVGLYTVQATDGQGCIAIDTIAVSTDTIKGQPTKTIPLCTGSQLTITASPGFAGYLWSDGSTQQTFTTTNAGTYWVTFTDAQNCQATDTAIVVQVPLPSNFLIPDVTKCFYADVTLRAGNSYPAYAWSTGDKTAYATVLKGGAYTLTVTDTNGCIATETVNVHDSACPEYLYMPAAFTPNGDGVNDVFKPGFAGRAASYSFVVYNRWGQKVFASSDPAIGWDGTANGNPQQPGVYIWVCQYQLVQRNPVSVKGTVVLAR